MSPVPSPCRTEEAGENRKGPGESGIGEGVSPGSHKALKTSMIGRLDLVERGVPLRRSNGAVVRRPGQAPGTVPQARRSRVRPPWHRWGSMDGPRALRGRVRPNSRRTKEGSEVSSRSLGSVAPAVRSALRCDDRSHEAHTEGVLWFPPCKGSAQSKACLLFHMCADEKEFHFAQEKGCSEFYHAFVRDRMKQG